MFNRSCSSASLNRYESEVFLVFPEKRLFILWSSTSLRQFTWDRSKYSSKDRGLDPCHDIEDRRCSNEHITFTRLGTGSTHIGYVELCWSEYLPGDEFTERRLVGPLQSRMPNRRHYHDHDIDRPATALDARGY
jgi:hypothetical protein